MGRILEHARRGPNLAGPGQLLRTATQQARDPVELLTCLLRAATPIVANLAIPGR